MKIMIKASQVRRWHPDKFEQKLGSRIAPKERQGKKDKTLNIVFSTIPTPMPHTTVTNRGKS